MVTWLFQLVSAQLGSETRIYISYCNACVFLKYIMLLLLLLLLLLSKALGGLHTNYEILKGSAFEPLAADP